MRFATLFAALALAILATLPAPSARAQSVLSPDFAATEPQLSPSERAGREIWMFATAFNDRFFTYTFPQRLGGAIDWYGILGAEHRGDLFEAWGAIPDPDCCIPGDPDCPARSPTETWGFPWCPGDDELLAFVGREGYRDPACDFADAPFDTSTAHGAADQRQSTCDLYFGTSTGALGLRKFPNPRFEPAAWEKIGGWEGYAAFLSDDPAEPRQPAEPPLGRLGRAAVPHRHGLRRLPHRLRAGQPAGRPRPPGLGEHRRAGRQPVQPHLRAPRQRASRRIASSGSSSPAPGRASSTPRPCRWTSSPTRAR